LISVIVPTYNDGHTLGRALRSICSQTHSDWECVVVDDGSEPAVTDLPAGIRDDRIRIVRHPRNLGRGAARLTGLRHSSNDLIAWQDADDWSHPKRFERQADFLGAFPNVDFVATGVFVTDGQECLGVSKGGQMLPRLLKGLEDPPVAHPTLMFRRRVLDEVTYRMDLPTAEDYDFLFRALRTHHFATLNTPLYGYGFSWETDLRKYWRTQRVRIATVMAASQGRSPAAWIRSLGFLGRVGVYAAARCIGQTRRLALRSYQTPTPEDLLAYEAALRTIEGIPDGG
jgi:glycosyltransferase involved in cell wall biosynthesis